MTEPAASPEATLLSDLLKLARKGSYVSAAVGSPAAAFEVFSPRNAFAAPIATLLPKAIEAALALQWLEQGDAQGRLKLSASGARRVRHYLSQARANPARCKAPGANTQSAAVPAKVRTQPHRIEGPLAWLRRRRDRQGRALITETQFEAGQRLAADHARAQLQGRVTASWSLAAPCHRAQRASPDGGNVSDMALAARDRIYRIITALGPECSRLLIDVCCNDIGLEAAERARGWPARSAKVVLDMGLTQLARHYGMLRDEPVDARNRMRRWSDAAFAPDLAQWL